MGIFESSKKEVLFIILATGMRNAFMLLPISTHNLEPSAVVLSKWVMDT